MKLISKYLLSLILVASVNVVFAQDFEEYMRQQQEAFEEMQSEYEAGILASIEAWEEYEARQKAAFEAYKEEMERLWGEFKTRSHKDWVEYREGGRVRSAVDFEEGKGTVEIIAETPEEVEEAVQNIQREVEITLEDRGSDREYPMEDEETQPLQEEPVLAGQVKSSSGATATAEVAKEISETVETREVTGEDGITRTVVFVNFSLAPDHLQTRARKVERYVYEYAKEFNLDPALVFAIIHTESYYNPAARSWANALGLMQLVPSTGGRDAYRALYNKDGVPTQDYLFIPQNNVRMGAVYMDILFNRYLRGVEDPAVLELLVICAYNTGAGNVARAYTGNTNFRAALPVINTKTPEETFHFLVENLPYEETQDYIQKVTERRDMYREWVQE